MLLLGSRSAFRTSSLVRRRNRRLHSRRHARHRPAPWSVGLERLEQRVLLFAPIGYADSYTVPYDSINTSADGLMSVLANDVDYSGP